MEPIEPIEPELEGSMYSVMDEQVGPTEEHMMCDSSFKEIDAIENESAYYEKFLLDDFDNYLDEINDRLTVSRLVTDSVIKGMVNAVVEAAAEEVASKDAEIAQLKERLRASNYSTLAAADRLEPLMLVSEPLRVSQDRKKAKSFQGWSYVDNMDEWAYPEHFGRMRMFVESQVRRLKDDITYVGSKNYYGITNVRSANLGLCGLLPQPSVDDKFNVLGERVDCLKVTLAGIFDKVNDMFSSMKVSTTENNWKRELHEEINTIAMQNFITDIQDGYETKIFEQRKVINVLSANYEQKVNELSSVREDLNAISKSLLNSDQNLLLSHASTEGFEELNNTKWKDQFHLMALGNNNSSLASHTGENGATLMQEPPEFGNAMLEFAELPHLKHLSKEELATYYIIEMTKMRRQHDKAMEEKTDELFRLKREFLKEKSSWLSKKDKELEHLKKNIRRMISKLDDIPIEKGMLVVVNDDCDEFFRLKDKINSMFFENQRLRDMLIGKRKEIECLSAQVIDAASQILLHSSIEGNLLEQIKKLKEDLENLIIEVGVKEELDVIILKEVISKHILRIEDVEVETKFIHEIYSVLFKELTSGAVSIINAIMLKHHAEKASLESMLSEKEIALHSEIEGNSTLKQELASLSTLIREKEKFASEAGSTITQQKEHFDLVKKELDILRDQVNKQGLIISGSKIQSDSMRNQLDETLQKFHVYEQEIGNLNQKLAFASNSLEESERQKTIFHDIVKEKERKLSNSNMDGNNQQTKQLEAIMGSLDILLEVFLDFESNFTGIIERNELRGRLTILSSQCSSLKQQVNLLLNKDFFNKRMFEMMKSNLQKAEDEVNLLGDEVDALLALLGKVYVALDHYSPVLQHYTGVMEILNLVRRELQGETAASR